ncbi:MAG TPA: arylsulfatase [Candidatus Polarisedimenticolaceae bacterium]|nr:arylsulfatase [Candidatus Polarisedimenticolaceae bacterium]
MKRVLTTLAAALLTTAAGAQSAPRPHVLFILADDLGWKDVGFHGSDIRTPNLDKLAAAGTELQQFYTLPMCTPSRAALLTGRYPWRYGLQTGVIPPQESYGIPTDEWLLPQALKDAGYLTAIVGKWHLGHGDKKLWPRQRGFDHQYGPLIGEIDYFTHEASGKKDWYRNNEPVAEKGYSTTLFGDEAVRLIEGQEPGKPLFLYLAFNAPHTPYQAPQEYLDRYKNIEDPSRRAYAGSITALDDQVGRVLAALDRKGMRGNTLIVFMSDNGGTRNALFTGGIADVSKIKIPCDNGPYREGKGTNYEGGTRVVAFVTWPGHVQPGTVEGMLHMVDLYPTLVALAGGKVDKAKPLDGSDAWSTISTGATSPRSEVVYNVEPFRAALRDGDWKLVWRTTLPAKVELYNLAQDPGEKNDLSTEHPDKVAAMKARVQALATEAAKPKLLDLAFGSVVHQYHLPPAFPGEEYEFAQEP